MGAAGDVLQVVLGPEGTGMALAGALATWLRTRRRRLTVEINGNRVEIDGAKDPEATAELLITKLSAPSG